MPQPQRKPQRNSSWIPRPSNATGSGGGNGGNIGDAWLRWATRLHLQEWLVSISLIVLLLSLFPRSVDEITLLGIKVGPLKGYKDIVNVVLALGLYRLISALVVTIPEADWQKGLKLSLNFSSKEFIASSLQDAKQAEDLEKYPKLTQYAWAVLERLVELTQLFAVVLIYVAGLYYSFQILYLGYTDPALPDLVNLTVLSLASLFLAGVVLRAVQALSFMLTQYLVQEHKQRQRRNEQLKKIRKRQIKLARQEEERRKKQAEENWLRTHKDFIKVVYAAIDTVDKIWSPFSIFSRLFADDKIANYGEEGKEVWITQVMEAISDFQVAWSAFREESGLSHFQSLLSVQVFIQDISKLDFDSPGFEEKVTTLYEKYKEDIDALKRLKRERFENPVVKSLLAEEA